LQHCRAFSILYEVDNDNKYLSIAIELAVKSIDQGGGPFGAVIVYKNKIISQTNNQVNQLNDPTAHAEIMAIREACNYFKDFRLSECVLYSSCEPCPMCLGAIYWARIPSVIFASSRIDAANAGFDDQKLYEEILNQNNQDVLRKKHLALPHSNLPFQKWLEKTDKKLY